MAIPYPDSIQRTTAQPRFTDEVFATIVDRDAFLSTLRYEGLSCYVVADQTSYILKGGILNANWEEYGGGAGGGFQVVADITARNAIPTPDRVEGQTVVYVTSEQKNYQLVGGILDANWKILSNNISLSTTQTLTGGGSITRLGGQTERVKVQGTSGETSVTISASPTPLDGDQLFIQGMSDAHPILVGPFYLTAGLVGHLIYDAATTSWLKVGGV